MLGLLMLLGQAGDAQIKELPRPIHGLAIAHADAAGIAAGKDPRLLPSELPFQRYVWVPASKGRDVVEDAKAVSGALHYASRSGVVGTQTRPAALARGGVLRVDLRRYARARNFQLGDLGDWLRLWEAFAFDPYFATLITADQIKAGVQVDAPTVKQHRVEWEWDGSVKGSWTDAEGKVWKGGWRKKNVVTEGRVTDFAAVRLDGLHLPGETWRELCALLHTQAPIVHAGTMVSRMLSTIEDDGLYRLVYGGLYFEFKGVPLADPSIKGDSDELALYRSLGVDTRGKSLDQFFEEITGDRKIGLFFSKVSGRARQVIMINNLVDPDDPAIYVTRDVLADNIDLRGHAMANLLDFKHQATEVIWVKGFPGFALYDGKGKRVRVGDVKAVSDGEIPRPYPPLLESGIGCIRCHRHEQGYRPAPNDVQKLIPAGDVGRFGKEAHDKRLRETQDRIVELYQGNSKSRLDRSRNRLNEVVLLATGPWKGSADQTDVAGLLGKQLADIVHEHKYELVTPELACRDLGFVPPGKDADEVAKMSLKLLQELLKQSPDDPSNKYLLATLGFIPEDFRLAGLLAGIPITRTDWQLSYSHAAARAQRNWAEIEARARKK